MSDFFLLSSYIQRTGQSLSDMLLPLSNYEFKEIIKLVKEAERKKMKLVFYFKSPEDEKKTKYSHKFE